MDEIELKLSLSPEAADAIQASGILPGQPVTVRQQSVYFDTPDRALAGNGLSLRIRTAKGKRIQTIKQGGGPSAGVFARSEWEIPVEGDLPVPDDRTPVPALLDDLSAQLAAIFTVTVARSTWTFDHGGARIEAVIDRGEVTAADRQSPFCECELELLSGPPKALFALARQLDAPAPVKLGVQTKSERGLRLIAAAPLAIKAADPGLDAGMTAAEGFQRIVMSCLRQFRLNEDLLLASRAAEPLHQARVALRRLRSALTIFRPMLGASDAALREELRWLAGSLGEARDLDVLLTRAPAGPLRDRIRTGREAAHDHVAGVLDSDRVRVLMLDLAEWSAGGGWLSDPDFQDMRQTGIRDFAATALSRFRRKVRKGGQDLAALSEEARHDLRKDAKKLRYAADFFDPLFHDRHPKARKRFAAALSDFQDHLGALNDMAAAPLVLERLGLADAPGAADLIASGEREPLLAAAEASHGALSDAKAYWK